MQSEQSAILHGKASAIASAIDAYVRTLPALEQRAGLYRRITNATVRLSMAVDPTSSEKDDMFVQLVHVPASRYADGDMPLFQELMFRLGQILTVRSYVEHCSAREAASRKELAGH